MSRGPPTLRRNPSPGSPARINTENVTTSRRLDLHTYRAPDVRERRHVAPCSERWNLLAWNSCSYVPHVVQLCNARLIVRADFADRALARSRVTLSERVNCSFMFATWHVHRMFGDANFPHLHIANFHVSSRYNIIILRVILRNCKTVIPENCNIQWRIYQTCRSIHLKFCRPSIFFFHYPNIIERKKICSIFVFFILSSFFSFF